MISQVQGSGINTEQQKKTWLINWYFENDPTSSIYLATLRNPALVASYQTNPGMLYGTPFATGMENYFQKIKVHFGQSLFDQLVTEFAQQSNLYVDEIKVDEWHIYGSSRLGVYEANRTISKRIARDLNNNNQITNNEYLIETPEEVIYLYSSYQLERGAKRYELANHLGNVLTVISDKKTANFIGTNFTHFTAERISATDYSPFGAPLAGRTWNAGEYRFGFNTQERDDEIAGVGNIMTAQFWEYDARLGRRWNLDPMPSYWESRYAVNHSNPIFNLDKDGAKPFGNVIYNFLGRVGTAIGNIFSSNKKVWKEHDKPESSSDHTKFSELSTGIINFLSGDHYSSIPMGDWDVDKSFNQVGLVLQKNTKNHRSYEITTTASELVRNHKMRFSFDRSALDNFTFGIISFANFPVLTNFPGGFIPQPSWNDPITNSGGMAGLTGVGQLYGHTLSYTLPFIMGLPKVLGQTPIQAFVEALGVLGLTSIVNFPFRDKNHFQLDIYAVDMSLIKDLKVEVKYRRYKMYKGGKERPFWHKWIYGVSN